MITQTGMLLALEMSVGTATKAGGDCRSPEVLYPLVQKCLFVVRQNLGDWDDPGSNASIHSP